MRILGVFRVHNGEDVLPRVLDALSGWCDDIYAIDDRSTDNSAQILRHHPAVTNLVRARSDLPRTPWLIPEPPGLELLYRMADFCQPDWIVMIDSDQVVEADVDVREVLAGTPADVAALMCDVVFHLAANVNVDKSLDDPGSFLETNVMGTHHVLEAAREHGSRVIFASTCEVYGDGHSLAPDALLDETAELRPNSPYAASKAAADRLCYSYFRSYGMDISIVRPFNIFGERQKSGAFGALIAILVRRAIAGQDLTVFGDGSATRDYLHVSDAVDAYRLVLETPDLRAARSTSPAARIPGCETSRNISPRNSAPGWSTGPRDLEK